MVELYRVEGSLSLISMIGSFVIILTFVLMKSLRKHPTSLIFFLALCDFFFSFKYFASSVYFGDGGSMSLQKNEVVCALQAAFAQFWGLGSIGWIGMISINLIISLRNPFANTERYVKFYHVWIWGYAILTTVLMLVRKETGESGDGTCWIKQNKKKDATNPFNFTFFIPLVGYFILATLALLYAHVRTKQTTDRHQSETVSLLSEERQQTKAKPRHTSLLMLRMQIFVGVFVLCWSGTIAHRIAQYYNYEAKLLRYWDAVGVSLLGFANACVWISHPLVFSSCLKLMKRVYACCLCGRQKDNAEPELPFFHIKLINEFATMIEDPTQDIQQLDVTLRKHVITSILLGIKRSIQTLELDRATTSMLLGGIGVRDLISQYNTAGKYETVRGNSALVKPLLQDFKEIQLQYTFRDFSPAIFECLRQLSGVSREDYLKSLEPQSFLGSLNDQKFSEGKSGSFFCFSPEKNYIIKTIEEHEVHVLRKILPSYYEHFVKYPNSLLIRIYGLHALKIQNDVVIYVMVMGNFFNTPRKIHEKYDLKGSWVARSTKEHAENPSALGKDMDLKRKLKLSPSKRTEILTQLEADVTYLSSQGIIDYSLLLGFHFKDRESPKSEDEASIELTSFRSSSEVQVSESRLVNQGVLSEDGTEIYFMGVIDMLQLYNLNKKMERWLKVHLLAADKDGLSVQPTDIYCQRFLSAMRRIMTPDNEEEEEEAR